jgi:membrane protein DedA with SNARE-associated domain
MHPAAPVLQGPLAAPEIKVQYREVSPVRSHYRTYMIISATISAMLLLPVLFAGGLTAGRNLLVNYAFLGWAFFTILVFSLFLAIAWIVYRIRLLARRTRP